MTKLSRYAIVFPLYDSAGFKVRMGKRRKVGYDQYTKVIWVTITPEDLIALRVYPDPKPGGIRDGLLSRVRLDCWKSGRKKMVGLSKSLSLNKLILRD
jgi:hypothetical protein